MMMVIVIMEKFNKKIGIWISSKQQYFTTSTLAQKVANWPPNLIGILFLPWGPWPSEGLCGRVEVLFSVSGLTHNVKPLRPISMIVPIGMFNFEFNLSFHS
jgi:hypothetical protein